MTSRDLSAVRLLDELRAIAARYPAMRLVSAHGEAPILEGEIEAGGRARRIRLDFPPGYPRVPPRVWELDPDSVGVAALIIEGRPHYFVDGSICLFPHGEDQQRWRRDRLAVEALDRLESFFSVAPADESRLTLHRGSWNLHVPPGLHDVLMTGGTGVLVARHGRWDQELFVTHTASSSGEAPGFERAQAWSQILPVRVEIPWAVIRSNDPWPELVGTRALLEQTIRRELGEELHAQYLTAAVIVLGRANGDFICVAWTLPYWGMTEIPIVRGTPMDALFNRVDGVIHQRKVLARQRVILVGLGSLGSAIAVALARAGVQRFVLIDPESLGIENICRHVGTLRELGLPKVDAMTHKIHSINPEAEISIAKARVAWDLARFGLGAGFEELLVDDSLVICTCAEHVTEREINAVAVEAGVPVIYATALGAAEHGRVFRVCPRRSPCYECILIAQDAEPLRYPRFGSALGGERAPAYLAPGLPGLAIDLTELAMITARFTLQTIAELRGVDLGLPPAHGDHLLWTSRGGWIFDGPLQVRWDHFPRSSHCPVCAKPPGPAALDEAEAEELDRLLDGLRR